MDAYKDKLSTLVDSSKCFQYIFERKKIILIGIIILLNVLLITFLLIYLFTSTSFITAFKYNLFEQITIPHQHRDYFSLKTCFNYTKCNTDKINILILKLPNSTPDFVLTDNADIIDFINDVEKACLVVLFMRNKKSTRILKEILNQMEIDINLLIIDTPKNYSSFDYASYESIYQYFNKNKRKNNDTFFSDIENVHFNERLKCSLISSYSQMEINENIRHKNLDIHFSIIDLPNSDIDSIIMKNNFLLTSSKRHFLFTYHQNKLDSLNEDVLSKVQKIKNIFDSYSFDFNHDIQLDCKLDKSFRTLNLCFDTQKRTKYLINSTFTLILIPTKHVKALWSIETTIRLIECLRVGTIPVFIQNDIQLPLSDVIAWNEAIIRLPVRHIDLIDKFLLDINQADIIKRRQMCIDIYKTYFNNSQTQFRTLITSLKQRLHLPTPSISNYIGINLMKKLKFMETFDSMEELIEYDDVPLLPFNYLPSKSYVYNNSISLYTKWNKYFNPFKLYPSTPHVPFIPNDLKYSIKIDDYNKLYPSRLNKENYMFGGQFTGKYFTSHLSGNYEDEQFTLVIYTFKRENILTHHLKKYIKLKYLNKIVIIWDSLNTKPSHLFLNRFRKHIEEKKIYLISNIKDSLNNRYLPYSVIQTDAIFNINDDTRISNEAIMLGFRVWRENRDQLIGYAPRVHSWHVKSQQFLARVFFKCEYSMVLTTAVFYHRYYNYIYTYMLDQRIRQKVDELMNCDDIAFNYMISHMTRKPPIKLTDKSFEKCTVCDKFNETRPLTNTDSFYKNRHDCINYFNLIFGYNPLLYSQYRIDSVTYKSRNHGKCFRNV